VFAAVEASLCALAAERRTSEELNQLGAVAHQLSRIREGREHRNLDRAFHVQIHAMAHSPVSAAVADGLWDRSEFFSGLLHDDGMPIRGGHEKLVVAISAADAHAAERAMHAHILGAVALTREAISLH